MSTSGKSPSSVFPADYATARKRFRDEAAARGWRLEAFSIGEKGPDGDELFIDAALLGSPNPRRAVVVSSGLHGVEGFFGSAVQCALLPWAKDEAPLPDDGALLLLHALDPYGFAWLRRFDEANVDLNRNFLLNGDVYKGSPPLYAEVDGLINPRYAPTRFDAFWLRTLWAICRHGMTELKQAVAGGQYDYPRGLFYGGRMPSRTQIILAANLSRWLGGAENAIHVDFHTGLGRWATYQLLLEPNLGPDRCDEIKEWFGADNVQVSAPEGIAYRSRGAIGPWCESLLPRCRYDYLCAEFGTCSSVRVLAALREENQAFHWCEPGDDATRDAKERLKEIFVPSDPRWREVAVAQGLAIVRRACEVSFGQQSALPSLKGSLTECSEESDLQV